MIFIGLGSLYSLEPIFQSPHYTDDDEDHDELGDSNRESPSAGACGFRAVLAVQNAEFSGGTSGFVSLRTFSFHYVQYPVLSPIC